LLSRVVDGLTAGNIAILYASVLDHFPRAEWARRFAYLSTATGAGILLGLVCSSIVAARGLPPAAAVGLALTLLSLVVTWRLLPETRRRPSTSPFAAWRQAAVGDVSRQLRRTALAVLLSTLAQTAFLLALPLYLARVLGYQEQEATLLIAGLFVLAAVFQMAALPRMAHRLGEWRAAVTGFGAVAVGGAGLALSASLVHVGLSGGVMMLGIATLASTLPALLGVTNRALDEGALMGLNQAVVSVGQMLGPLLGYGALLLPTTLGYGAVSVLLALSGVVVLRGVRVEAGDASS
jgi:DHA1 family tetracycline resistance protein-like MFS transporter